MPAARSVGVLLAMQLPGDSKHATNLGFWCKNQALASFDWSQACKEGWYTRASPQSEKAQTCSWVSSTILVPKYLKICSEVPASWHMDWQHSWRVPCPFAGPCGLIWFDIQQHPNTPRRLCKLLTWNCSAAVFVHFAEQIPTDLGKVPLRVQIISSLIPKPWPGPTYLAHLGA